MSKEITRKKFIELLNEDLAREYQAVIAYTVYSQTLKGAEYTAIAKELAVHATEELAHALQIAKQIDYLNGEPVTVPKAVKTSKDSKKMLEFDLENEKQTILNYRERIRQAEELGEFAVSEVLRKIIAQEQEHLTDLADALGIDNPNLEE
jgi:bacterioferritin